MTDSMKFGPEWLRNMSAEPSGGSTSSIYSLNAAAGVNTATSASASRNFLFPEYRYGREEMLSLFDRNCLLPQILPSFKKLFVEKVQYPLALTPSSEEDNSNPIGNSSRPAWLQRSSGGFGSSSRGTGRGGAVDRGRMRGKSVYHPIYQRPSAIFDENSVASSAINIKQSTERNWIDRNGTGDSAIANNTSVTTCTGGGGGGSILDWNATPNSSPRKEFASHHNRNSNMENWRRTRNEDGSGDGPVVAGSGSDMAAGWRSGGGGNTNNSFGTNSHRWGRSTSWRDDDCNVDSQQTNVMMHRSISSVGTVSIDRERKQIGTVQSSVRVSTSGVKSSQMWTGVEAAVTDDNLPEWAMENPSEVGGSFDASGAFHGTDHNDVPIIKNPSGTADAEIETKVIKDSGSDKESEKNQENCSNNVQLKERAIEDKCDVPAIDSKIMHGTDISDRIKEVAVEVEKLIMDDDNNLSSGNSQSFADVDPVMDSNAINESATSGEEFTAKSILPNAPFSEPIQLNHLQRHQPQHLHQQQQTPQNFSLLPPCPPLHQHQHSHLMNSLNSNLNNLWFYRDPQTNVQGPFSALEMTEWYRAGYFNENLFVRRFTDNRFRPLGELIKFCHGNMPFTHSHLLPSPLELEMEMEGVQKPLLEGGEGLRNENQQKLLDEGSLPVGNQQQQLLEGGLQQHLLPTAATLPTVALSTADLSINPLLPRKHQNDETLKANVTAAAEALTLAIKGNLMGNTSQLLSMRFQMLQDQYVQHQEYQILADLTKNDCFQRLSAIEREAIVRRKVQLIAFPDYLTSLNGLSNTLSVINPIAGRELFNLVAEQSKKDQQNVHQRSIVGNNQLDANNFILNSQLMQQQRQQPLVTQKPEELRSRHDLDLLNEYNLRMLLRGNGQQPTIAAETSQQINSSVGETQMLTAQNLMIPMWLPPQSVKPTNFSSQWPKGTLWDVATLEEEQNQQQQQLLMQKEQQQQPSSSFVEKKLAEENLKNEQRSLEECHEPHVVTDVHHQDVNKSLNETYKTKEEHKQPTNNKLHSNIRQHRQVNDEDQRRREQTEEKRRQKEERKRQQLEEEKRRALQEAEERARQLQEEKERQQQIQSQRRKALLGSNHNAQPQATKDAVFKIAGDQSLEPQKSSVRLPATSIAPWSLARSPNDNSTVAPGLAEIQKAERRERRADQQRHQEQLDKRSRANAAAQAEANDVLKWQSVAPTPMPVMSLAEIQAEEAKRLTNELRRDAELQQQLNLGTGPLPGGASGTTAGGATMSNIWGNVNKAWSGVSPLALSGSSGSWEETLSNQHQTSVGGSSAAASTATKSSLILQAQNKSNANSLTSPRNLRKSQTLPAIKPQNQPEKVKPKQKAMSASIEEKDKDRKPQFKGQADPSISKVNEYENEFTNWCMKSLDNMSAKVDVPTFVAFLQDLEAPYEVKDYVRIYLGEGKDSLDFAKQFLERRSKYKSLQRAQNAHNDDMCKPAPAITPSSNDNTDNKNKQKKVKKSKMMRMDARSILGFSVTAAEGRINVGVRDYVDGP